MWRRFPGSSRFTSGAVLVGAFVVAVGVVGWGLASPAVATPDATCAAAEGHGGPGCHADSTVTTAAGTSAAVETTDPELTTDSSILGVDPALADDSDDAPRYLDQFKCLSCHGDESLSKTLADGTSVSLYVNTDKLPMAVHRFLDCVTCHTAEPHEVETPLTKLSQAEKCGSCHSYQYDQHIVSVHGVPIAGGNSDPATCADCHSATGNPHNIVRVLDPMASAYRKNIADTCAKCHDDSELMDKYGIVEKVYDSYMRSFHGKAIQLAPDNATLQQLDEATCTNCHGVHNIQPVDDPTSPVAGMDHLLETCRLCHSDAGPAFVSGFLGHKAVSSEYFPAVYWGGKTFYIVSRAVLAGGALIVATSLGLRLVPWVRHKLKRRRLRPRNKKEE